MEEQKVIANTEQKPLIRSIQIVSPLDGKISNDIVIIEFQGEFENSETNEYDNL